MTSKEATHTGKEMPYMAADNEATYTVKEMPCMAADKGINLHWEEHCMLYTALEGRKSLTLGRRCLI